MGGKLLVNGSISTSANIYGYLLSALVSARRGLRITVPRWATCALLFVSVEQATKLHTDWLGFYYAKQSLACPKTNSDKVWTGKCPMTPEGRTC